MNFHRTSREDPEINLIPFIDVLLVVLIFLMLSTTYRRFTELELKLPVANTQAQSNYPYEIRILVNSDGAFYINQLPVPGRSVDQLSQALSKVVTKNAVVVIKADASARHQSVITVMEAAQRNGLTKITFATQREPK